MKPVVVVHHHEITLKRENRRFFEQVLMRNMRRALHEFLPSLVVRGGYGRFIIELSSNEYIEAVAERLTYVFGLANICSGVQVEQSLDVICRTAEELLTGLEFKTIKVHTSRPDKNFPLSSLTVNAKVGEHLCKRFGVRANLSEPDETVFVELVDGVAFVYRSKIRGAGGLPVGSSGKVISLLSAGFDSPIASWEMMKRGATVIFVHFHSMPYTSSNSLDQVRQLTEVLTRYQFQSKLYLVPFAEVQQAVVLQAPESLRVILYRRMMIRIAEAIARKEQVEALVTGEAVGQVASQTLRNIRIINSVATYPILRPISGNDKEETMALARRIGTYDISKEPYDDCCSFLAPRRPETWGSQEAVETAEGKLDIPNLILAAVTKVSVESLHFPAVEENTIIP